MNLKQNWKVINE